MKITVKQEPDRLLLSIQDDGKGFNPQQEGGMGLIGMEERVERLGGRLSDRIGAGPCCGWNCRARRCCERR